MCARVYIAAAVQGLTTPALDTFSYSASKAAVIHMSSVLAGRLIEHGITVNSISPGAFQSRMMRATIEAVGDDVLGERSMNGRIGVPSDIAGACLFLCARAGAWMTGCNLVLDGGSVVRPRL
jgi:NAD(P)-dependent dehydrogenase (short-subunit alcohol dehydrogenase family)